MKEQNNKKELTKSKDYLEGDINRWLKSIKIRCKKSTYSNYQYVIRARINPKFSHVKKKAITSEMINDYTEELLKEGLRPKTVKDILIILQQILKFSNMNVVVTFPKVPKNDIQILKKEEQAILEKKLLTNFNLTTLGIYICLYTGLRIGEVCALKWENIDLENKKIKINQTITRIKNPNNEDYKKTMIIIEKPKSISSIREIPIPDFMLSLLVEVSKDRKTSDFLVTGTNQFLETRTYFNRYKKILKEIHLSQYNFHALRHTFATRCVENGCDPKTLSEILGHSNVKITLERYVHPDYENKVKLMNQLHPMYQ